MISFAAVRRRRGMGLFLRGCRLSGFQSRETPIFNANCILARYGIIQTLF